MKARKRGRLQRTKKTRDDFVLGFYDLRLDCFSILGLVVLLILPLDSIHFHSISSSPSFFSCERLSCQRMSSLVSVLVSSFLFLCFLFFSSFCFLILCFLLLLLFLFPPNSFFFGFLLLKKLRSHVSKSYFGLFLSHL